MTFSQMFVHRDVEAAVGQMKHESSGQLALGVSLAATKPGSRRRSGHMTGRSTPNLASLLLWQSRLSAEERG